VHVSLQTGAAYAVTGAVWHLLALNGCNLRSCCRNSVGCLLNALSSQGCRVSISCLQNILT